MVTKRNYWTVKKVLKGAGYIKASENSNYIRAVLDYLDMMPEDYTIIDWLKDTEQNYPEDLREYDE